MLSKRAFKTNQVPEFLVKNLLEVQRRSYHKNDNPQGIVNMGTSENKTCEDIILPKINEILAKGVDKQCLYYYQFNGLECLRIAISRLLCDSMNLKSPLDPEKLNICTGVTSAINILAMALVDENETILGIGPCYGRFPNDVQEIANARFEVVPMWEESAEFGAQGNLKARILDETLKRVESKGQKVKAVIITNPNNPTGQIHTKEEILEILNYCKERKLHVIMDEIYALSIHSGGKFVSSFQLELPDPERTHMFWGLSKDFGLSGLRCGVIYTENKDVLQYISTAACFSPVPAMVQMLITDLLSDKDWINQTFLPTARARMEDNLKLARDVLQSLEIPVYPAQGGLFLWVNLQKYLPDLTEQCEMELFKSLLDQGVYIVPGSQFFCPEPGWFRIVVTIDKDILAEGLKRFEAILRAKPIKR